MAASKRSFSPSLHQIAAAMSIKYAWCNKLTKDGMPKTTIQDAVNWYVTTVKSRQTADKRAVMAKELSRKNNVFVRIDKRNAAGKKPSPDEVTKMVDRAYAKLIPTKPQHEIVVPDQVDNGQGIEDLMGNGDVKYEALSLPEQLEKTKEEAGFCHAMMVKSRGNPPMYDYWKKAYDRSFKQTFEVERDMMKIQLEAGKAIPIEALEEQLASLAKKLVQHIDRVPQRLSRKFSGKQKIAILEEGKKEVNHLKDILYEFSSTTLAE